jgi:hypothetical protein
MEAALMGKAKAILPRGLISNPAKMRQVIINTLNEQALAIQVDFQVTVATWEHQPTFSITANGWQRAISTNGAIYSMLNEGTRAHRIMPKRGKVLRFTGPFQAKTVPNSISSGPGGKGTNETFSKGVNHPGTKARNWDKAIAKKWRRLIGKQFQRAIDSAVN